MISSKKILLLLCLMVTVGRFALDSYLPSLPEIQNHFHASSNQVQLTLTVFLIGFSLSQFWYGALADYYGRRKIILTGFIIFLSGSLLCSVATSLETLFIARFIAGFGGGVSSSLKRAVASDIFHGFDLAKAGASQSNAVLITILIAPVIGSHIELWYGWRMNFLATFFYGLFVFLLLYRYLPDTRPTTSKPQSLTVRNIFGNYLRVLAFRPFFVNVTYTTCAFTGMVIFSQLSAFLLIDTLQLSVSVYGWLITLIACCYLFAGLIINYLGQYIGMKMLILMGLGFLFLSSIILFFENELQIFNIESVMVPALIYIFGARLIIPNAMARSISPFPEIAGYASSLMSIIQTSCAALGSYIISKFYTSDLKPLASAYCILFCISLFTILFLERPQEAEELQSF